MSLSPSVGKVLELFAGAGGAALGLHRAGFDPTLLVEHDESACATLRAAGCTGVVCGDVADLGCYSDLGPIDLVWSSFPCQPFSSAGKRQAHSDERNGWPATLSVLDTVRPTWFLGENVAGLLSHRKTFGSHEAGEHLDCPGCYLEHILLDLKCRFSCVGFWLLDAADFGIPQHRRRVFLWAGPKPLQPPATTHGGPGKPPYISMGEALGLTGSVQSGVAFEDSGRRGVPRVTSRPSPAVSASTRLYYNPELLLRPSPTVTTTEVKGTRACAASGWSFNGGPDRASDAAWAGAGIRRLTVEQCAILQGFPEDYPWAGTIEARYRQVGNAVPPALAEAVARTVVSALSSAG